jgi:hypothetical protein
VLVLDTAAVSTRGPRPDNQDSAVGGPLLIAIADGVGGNVGGAVASSLVASWLAPLASGAEGDGGEDPVRVVASANERIRAAYTERPRLRTMATTLTAVHADATDRYSFVMHAEGVEDLYPGADRRLVLTMTNPYAFDLLVTDIHAELAATSNAGCDPVPANLQLRDFTGDLPVRVAAGSDTESGAVPLHMPNSVVDACQRATFTIALDADATRADA